MLATNKFSRISAFCKEFLLDFGPFFSVRNALIVFALFSLIGGIAVFVTSIILIIALRKVSTKH